MMNRFSRRLDEALRGYHIGDTTPTGGPGPSFSRGLNQNYLDTTERTNTSEAYRSVKYFKTISDRLSRLTNHDIIILVGRDLGKYAGTMRDPDVATKLIELYKLTGISPVDFMNSATLLIVGDQGQARVTPWLIVHQFAEGIVQHYGDPWYTVYKKYQRHLSYVPDHVIGHEPGESEFEEGSPEWEDEREEQAMSDDPIVVRNYAYGHADMQTKAFHHLFKMKSAREFIDFDTNIDCGQEIITEYLWHGGKIRMNKPDWLDPGVVEAIRSDLTKWIDTMLTKLKGTRFPNQRV